MNGVNEGGFFTNAEDMAHEQPHDAGHAVTIEKEFIPRLVAAPLDVHSHARDELFGVEHGDPQFGAYLLKSIFDDFAVSLPTLDSNEFFLQRRQRRDVGSGGRFIDGVINMAAPCVDNSGVVSLRWRKETGGQGEALGVCLQDGAALGDNGVVAHGAG